VQGYTRNQLQHYHWSKNRKNPNYVVSEFSSILINKKTHSQTWQERDIFYLVVRHACLSPSITNERNDAFSPDRLNCAYDFLTLCSVKMVMCFVVVLSVLQEVSFLTVRRN